ncbi:MAG: hypothetical protein PWQ59_300, partial [Thermoanaerobacterium sp.]|nr:hypothetical protein [Thermoanaerobacterium sp.]MDN5317464.1 hypothetical protein [Thermoanaerobacterium sp.]
MFNEKNNEKKLPVNLQFALDESMDLNYNARKNFGYAALSKIYHELEIDKFLRNRQRHSNEEYDANAIMKLLVFSRLLYPLLRKRLLKTKMFSLISLIFHWMMCIDVLLFSTSIVMLYNFGSMSILSLCMIGIQIWFIMMLLTITLRLMNRMNFEKKGFLKSIGLKNLVFDADTGEISESVRQHLIFDEEKLREEEKFDGYYAIVTSEYKETPEKIIDMYR